MICGIDANVLIYSAVESMPEHAGVIDFFDRRVLSGELTCAVAFPVLLESIHITTDPKRFGQPLSMEESLDIAGRYWDAVGWERVVPKATTGTRALALLRQHSLGRKRLTDTYFAATLLDQGIGALITCNGADFRVFEAFELIDPLKS